MNLSGSLLIWTLGQMPNEFYQKLENTYIGCIEWEGEDSWGKYYYVKTKEDYSSTTLIAIRNHVMYENDFVNDEGNHIIVFKFSEEQIANIVKPFISGKYSQIDRHYAGLYFKKFTGSGVSTNWQILNKDDDLRASWEQELNVTPYIRVSIPEGAEVWSKIKKENEILGYEAYIEAQEEVLESM